MEITASEARNTRDDGFERVVTIVEKELSKRIREASRKASTEILKLNFIDSLNILAKNGRFFLNFRDCMSLAERVMKDFTKLGYYVKVKGERCYKFKMSSDHQEPNLVLKNGHGAGSIFFYIYWNAPNNHIALK